MKKVLITGISGFLGQNIAKKFLKEGFYIVGIDIIPCGITEIEFYHSEVSLNFLLTLNHKFDYIFHCAGGSTVSASFQNPYLEFNNTVNSSVQILEYIKTSAPNSKFIYPSSAAVYGQEYFSAIKETDGIYPISPYGHYKKIVEELCFIYNKNFGVKSNIIRFFSLYGEGLKKQLLWDACNKFILDDKPVFYGTGNEVRDWLYIDDAAELSYMVALQGNEFQIINGGTGKGVKINQILELLAKEINYEKEFKFNNVSNIGNPEIFIANIEKAEKYGWKPKTELSEGLKNYVKWFKEQN